MAGSVAGGDVNKRRDTVRPQFIWHVRTNKCLERDKINSNEVEKWRNKMTIAIDVEEWKIKRQIYEYLVASLFCKCSQI